ncbi:hypothetical protein A3J13_01090 [Candidatus Daviesbacteria bacterium RIFCSPLOWO2_02_FULL_36_8]|uniref:Uncharacterized protein n=1 Tax=Candidatus Daviesbacteria bacterium RIFCSPLOWO2_02_FULL_36_8 TaxID=1797793 RepID=A0A1F5MFD6_9BACT|nr:MAG: hypothetical protein A3J13_01090 [Candidatus Daviesbacteria bacterium RIFCSPLOWO2_02_FULL_36_8]
MAVGGAETKPEILVPDYYTNGFLNVFGYEAQYNAPHIVDLRSTQDQVLLAIGQDVQEWFKQDQAWEPEGLIQSHSRNTGSIDIVLTTTLNTPTVTERGRFGRPDITRLNIPATLAGLLSWERYKENSWQIIRGPRNIGPLRVFEDLEDSDFSAFVRGINIKPVNLYDPNSHSRKVEDLHRVRVSIGLADAPSRLTELHSIAKKQWEALGIQEEELMAKVEEIRAQMKAVREEGPKSMNQTFVALRAVEDKPWPGEPPKAEKPSIQIEVRDS